MFTQCRLAPPTSQEELLNETTLEAVENLLGKVGWFKCKLKNKLPLGLFVYLTVDNCNGVMEELYLNEKFHKNESFKIISMIS